MTTRATPRDTPARMATDAADGTFAALERRLTRVVDAIVDKPARARARAWIEKMRAPEKNAALKMNRNRHAELLLAMLLAGDVRRPFDGLPTSGRLARFAWDDAVGYGCDRVLERADAAAAAADGGRGRGTDAAKATRAKATRTKTGGGDASARAVEAECGWVSGARARVGTSVEAVGTEEKSREALQIEVKQLRAKVERQSDKIASLKEELAREREGRTRELASTQARHEREVKKIVASARGVRAPPSSSAPSPPTLKPLSSAGVDFDDFIAKFQAETGRLRKALERGRGGVLA